MFNGKLLVITRWFKYMCYSARETGFCVQSHHRFWGPTSCIFVFIVIIFVVIVVAIFFATALDRHRMDSRLSGPFVGAETISFWGKKRMLSSPNCFCELCWNDWNVVAMYSLDKQQKNTLEFGWSPELQVAVYWTGVPQNSIYSIPPWLYQITNFGTSPISRPENFIHQSTSIPSPISRL